MIGHFYPGAPTRRRKGNCHAFLAKLRRQRLDNLILAVATYLCGQHGRANVLIWACLLPGSRLYYIKWINRFLCPHVVVSNANVEIHTHIQQDATRSLQRPRTIAGCHQVSWPILPSIGHLCWSLPDLSPRPA